MNFYLVKVITRSQKGPFVLTKVEIFFKLTVLVIAQFRAQFNQCFTVFSYFVDLIHEPEHSLVLASEARAKYVKREQYWSIVLDKRVVN